MGPSHCLLRRLFPLIKMQFFNIFLLSLMAQGQQMGSKTSSNTPTPAMVTSGAESSATSYGIIAALAVILQWI